MPNPVPVRPVLAGLVVAATLPYLALKILWLTGHPVGVVEPGFLHAPGILVGNVVTAALDGVAILLAVVLARAAVRPPGWIVVLTGWVGAGLLVPIAFVELPAILADALVGTGGAGPEPLAGWVRPMVYGGFTVQALGLVALLGLHARARWARVLRPAAPLGWARTVTALATVPTGLLVVVDLAHAAGWTGGLPAGGSWSAGAAVVAVVQSGLAVVGVIGTRSVTAGRRSPALVAAAALGSGSSFAWGLYGTATTVGATAFAATTPLDGLATLIGMLAGLALGFAALGALAQVPSGPDAGPPSSTSASKQVWSPV